MKLLIFEVKRGWLDSLEAIVTPKFNGSHTPRCFVISRRSDARLPIQGCHRSQSKSLREPQAWDGDPHLLRDSTDLLPIPWSTTGEGAAMAIVREVEMGWGRVKRRSPYRLPLGPWLQVNSDLGTLSPSPHQHPPPL
jgi:hypothetical protein